jgi:polyferredoxin
MNDKRRDRRDVELDRYFSLARQAPPDISGVERNFETRVMARIREGREPWYAWAWRLAPIFLALTILLAGWSVFFSPVHPADPVTMLASGPQEVALLDYLTGE